MATCAFGNVADGAPGHCVDCRIRDAALRADFAVGVAAGTWNAQGFTRAEWKAAGRSPQDWENAMAKAPGPIGIHLQQDSFIDERTGEVSAPSEFMANLRAIETNLRRRDDEIADLKADLKAARESREKLVAQLRAAVREGKVLPLLEVADATDEGT